MIITENINDITAIIEGMRLSKEEVAECLMAGAYTLMRNSMQQIEEQDLIDTGFMLDSHEVVEADGGVEMRVNADYAGYVEFGTSKMPARPFVRPAMDNENIDAAIYTKAASIVKGKVQ